MLPGLLPGSDFRKNYDFYWQISPLSPATFDASQFIKINGVRLDNASWLAFIALLSAQSEYICQLARSISLPDDEIELEEFDYGRIKIPVAKVFKMGDINVTYLEDSLNTVYNFHKTWMEAVKEGEGFYVSTIKPWCCSGTYVALNHSMSETVFKSSFNKNLNDRSDTITKSISNITNTSITGSHVFSPVQFTSDMVQVLKEIRGIQVYPLIYPTKISRGTFDKSGSDIATIQVTYKRLANLKNKPKAYEQIQ